MTQMYLHCYGRSDAKRRMEFVFEPRLLDIKRWKKINYMSATQYPDNLLGLWINVKEELPSLLVNEKVGLLKVKKPMEPLSAMMEQMMMRWSVFI